MDDMIFVSLENWDEVWRRNQFLCAELARRHPAMRLLFIEPAQDMSHAARRGDWKGLCRPARWQVPGMKHITVSRPIKLAPNSLGAGRAINQMLVRRHIRRAARRLGMQHPLLWINPHDAAHLAGRLGEAAVVYDITDDWALAAETPEEQKRIEAADRALCQWADLTVVCSQALYDSRADAARRLMLVPNGVDIQHYARAGGERKASGAGPVFGYTGTLHPWRFDVELVLGLARAFPAGRIELIGPDHLTSEARGRLDAAGNVRRLGPVAYTKLPDQMSGFDVCIVPHVQTPFTESLNPIKLWEYLAAGLPIVASDVAGFRDHADLCHIATGPGAFVQACRAALAEGDRLVDARRARAAQHSWASRVDQLEAALAGLMEDLKASPSQSHSSHADSTVQTGSTQPLQNASQQP